uniref:Ig-like domain-containing protein n=1 Tax=Anabas testudineus TaxID=64144 RepID=A0A3Q1JBD2_ANATE
NISFTQQAFALVSMAAELVQDQLSVTRRVGETVSISCTGVDDCDNNYIYWYQKKETFTLILGVNRYKGNVNSEFNHPQKKDFSAVRKQNGCELVIIKISPSHSASYYCSSSEFEKYLVFGSGTKLYVTDEQVLKPVVSVYPAATKAKLKGKNFLLCVASDMSPRLVQFYWTRRKENGPLVELPPGEGEQLELGESGSIVAIREVDQDALHSYKYSCHVKHEWGTVKAPVEQGDEDSVCPAVVQLHGKEDSLICFVFQRF